MLEKYKRKVMRKPEKLVIEGETGAGKTTFACSSHTEKEPVFVINSDDGGENVFHKTGINLIHDCIPTGDVKENAEKWDSVMGALRELATDKTGVKRVIIDSVDKLELLAQGKVCQEHKCSTIEDPGYGKGYLYASGHVQKLLSGLNYLRDSQSIQPILVCHTQIRTINKPTMEPYDSFILKLHKSNSANITEWADVILFVAFETIIKKIDAGFNRKDNRAMQSGNRFLYTSGSMGVDAKNRFDLPPEIPADWNEYRKLIDGFWDGNKDNSVTPKKG